jgi:hypothetical protein
MESGSKVFQKRSWGSASVAQIHQTEWTGRNIANLVALSKSRAQAFLGAVKYDCERDSEHP